MIERYSDPTISELFSDKNKYRHWLQYELDRMVELDVPRHTINSIKNAIVIDDKAVKAIKKIERSTKHDVVAFIKYVENKAGKDARMFHFGLTSSDVVDSVNSALAHEALLYINVQLSILRDAIRSQMLKHRYTHMLARTHGQAAEPTTLGLKLCGWYTELNEFMNYIDLILLDGPCQRALGSVGIAAHRDLTLGKSDVGIGMQIIPRERFANITSILAIVASMIERFALDIRLHAQTGIGEITECFDTKNQVGSSSMPHKRNPISCENICGMARLMRGYSQMMLENIATWSERDISHSSVDRVVIPDSFHVMAHMIKKFTAVMNTLNVDEHVMYSNIVAVGEQVLSQYRMNAKILAGEHRSKAHSKSAKIDKYDQSITLRSVLTLINDKADMLIPIICQP